MEMSMCVYPRRSDNASLNDVLPVPGVPQIYRQEREGVSLDEWWQHNHKTDESDETSGLGRRALRRDKEKTGACETYEHVGSRDTACFALFPQMRCHCGERLKKRVTKRAER